MRALKATADATYGFIGRSPEQVAGLITGLAMNPSVLENLHAGFGDNLMRYYEHARRERSLSLLRGDAADRHARDRAVSRARSATIPTCRWWPRTTRASPCRA